MTKCRIVNSARAGIQALKVMEPSACQSIQIMATQAWPEEGQVLIDKAAQAVKSLPFEDSIQYFQENVLNEILPLADNLIREQKREPRVLENVSIVIRIADDRQAGIVFPNNSGEAGQMDILNALLLF
jgi:hypothetical protein